VYSPPPLTEGTSGFQEKQKLPSLLVERGWGEAVLFCKRSGETTQTLQGSILNLKMKKI